MNCSFLKAVAVAVVVAVAVLAASAGAASYVSSPPLPAGFLSSPPFLWVAANAIVVWLVSSYQQHRTAGAAVCSSDSHVHDVSNAMDSLYQSSDHGVFAAAVAVPDDAVVAPVSKRQTREARTAKRPNDRPRARKKSAGEERPRATVAAEAAKPDGADDESIDSAWESILRSGAARPVAVRKSETWGGEELPRMQRAADKAVARREMRKSATMVPPSPPHPAAGAPAAAKQGWRTRDVLVMAQDELLRRAESFIRRQHEHLRLQRQESELRQAMEHQRHRPAPIRV